jgi:hypothetical protein
LAADLVEDGPFPVGQVRVRPGRFAAQERRVGVVRAHLGVAPGGDLGGGAGVVGVEAGEHQPPQVSRVMAERADGGGDLRRGAGDAGVDEGQAVRVLAEVGVPNREAQEVQARDQLDDVHAVTLRRGGPGSPWCLPSADRLTAEGLVRGRAHPGARRGLARPGCRWLRCVAFIRSKASSSDDEGR